MRKHLIKMFWGCLVANFEFSVHSPENILRFFFFRFLFCKAIFRDPPKIPLKKHKWTFLQLFLPRKVIFCLARFCIFHTPKRTFLKHFRGERGCPWHGPSAHPGRHFATRTLRYKRASGPGTRSKKSPETMLRESFVLDFGTFRSNFVLHCHPHNLSGSAGASFQSRYTIAIVYRLMFFMYRKVSRYTPEGPPNLGYRKIMLEACSWYRCSSYRLVPIAL